MAVITGKMLHDLHQLQLAATMKSEKLGRFIRMTTRGIYVVSEEYNRKDWNDHIAILRGVIENWKETL